MTDADHAAVLRRYLDGRPPASMGLGPPDWIAAIERAIEALAEVERLADIEFAYFSLCQKADNLRHENAQLRNTPTGHYHDEWRKAVAERDAALATAKDLHHLLSQAQIDCATLHKEREAALADLRGRKFRLDLQALTRIAELAIANQRGDEWRAKYEQLKERS